MTTTMTCGQFEARLPDYMEGDLSGDQREAFERHAEVCAPCRPILDDLKSIVASASALGAIEPTRDLWSGIESRISAQVVPLASRRMVPLVRGLAAAGLLMAATAGVTWQLARRGRQPAAANTALANANPDLSPNGPGPVIITTPPQVASNVPPRTAAPDAPAVSSGRASRPRSESEPTVRAVRNGDRTVNAAAVYDREIARLHSVIESRRAELDPKTVAAIERSLAVIDTAIAQARSALAADPASRFLHGRLNDVLDKKVELLRTTAMLPARS
jgi:hypothetical protein